MKLKFNGYTAILSMQCDYNTVTVTTVTVSVTIMHWTWTHWRPISFYCKTQWKSSDAAGALLTDTSVEWMFADTVARVQVFWLSDSVFSQLTALLLMPKKQEELQACSRWRPRQMGTELFESWGKKPGYFFNLGSRALKGFLSP